MAYRGIQSSGAVRRISLWSLASLKLNNHSTKKGIGKQAIGQVIRLKKEVYQLVVTLQERVVKE